MRVFIAVDIDEQTREALAKLHNKMQEQAQQKGIKKGDAKWVNPKNMHLTLKFLGEVKDEKIAEICNIVKDVAEKNQAFELDIESVGFFGTKAAKVLWIGTGQGGENLKQLANDVDENLAVADWPKETRQFSGHLTLCRVRNTKAGFKLAQMTEEYKNAKIGTLPVDSVRVYQSQLTPEGPIYTVLGNYKLKYA